jgi:hypothetical protein
MRKTRIVITVIIDLIILTFLIYNNILLAPEGILFIIAALVGFALYMPNHFTKRIKTDRFIFFLYLIRFVASTALFLVLLHRQASFASIAWAIGIAFTTFTTPSYIKEKKYESINHVAFRFRWIHLIVGIFLTLISFLTMYHIGKSTSYILLRLIVAAILGYIWIPKNWQAV